MTKLGKNIELAEKNQKSEKFLENLRLKYERNKDLQSEPYLNLSIELSQKIIQSKKFVVPFKIFLSLKMAARSGKIKAKDALKAITETLPYKDQRRPQEGLKQLYKLGWIGTDGTYYYLRSFHALERKFEVKTKRSGAIRKGDILNFSAWALTFFLASRFKKFNSPEKKAGRTRYNSKTNAKNCALSILAGEFSLSRSQVCRIRQQASKLKLIRYSVSAELQGDMSPYEIPAAEKYTELEGYHYGKDGQVFKRLPGKFEFNLNGKESDLILLHLKKRNAIRATT